VLALNEKKEEREEVLEKSLIELQEINVLHAKYIAQLEEPITKNPIDVLQEIQTRFQLRALHQ